MMVVFRELLLAKFRNGIYLGLLLLLVGAASCGESSLEKMSPQQRLAYAERIYQRDCAACHGEQGDGQGPEAHRLQTKPFAFTTRHFKFKSTPSGELPLDEDIFRSIAEGVPTTSMLPQAHLSEGEIWALVDYIKKFYPKFEVVSHPKTVAIPTAPPRTEELLELGKEMYEQAGCVKCHGTGGHGDGPAADSLRDYRDRPIEVPDLTYLPRKVGSDLEDLYRVIQTGMDGTPMPSYQGVFTERQGWALVYYLDRMAVNEWPRGMMGLVGEEVIGMRIDMRAAHALMMGRRGMMGRGMMRRRNN